jgi:O-acetyl-ADP-ribose deacetylase (regulator of RNase III)
MNNDLLSLSLPGERRLVIAQGDLTEEHVDAIVNAANEYLQHGGGLAAAISWRGGPEIQKESNAWVKAHGPVSHAEPAYTGPGRLPCRYVIHAVGPVWGSGDEDRKLAEAVQGSLALADRLKLGSIAFPAISTGIFGFPKERAARIILDTIRKYFDGHPESGLKLVKITLFDRPSADVFVSLAK